MTDEACEPDDILCLYLERGSISFCVFSDFDLDKIKSFYGVTVLICVN